MDTIDSILKRKGSAVWSVSPDATVYEAVALLAEKDVGALPVISEGVLVGMFSERDYARKVVLEGKSSRDIPVHEIMTTRVITVDVNEKVEECMRIMTHHHVRHLPVLDCGKLAGLVSIGDLVNAIISDQAHTIEQLSNYITGKYPGA